MPGSAIGINHLTGSVASLVAPTTTSMWPLKDVCCLVALFVHLAFGFCLCLCLCLCLCIPWHGTRPLQIEIEISWPSKRQLQRGNEATRQRQLSRQRSSSSRAPLACHPEQALQANLLRHSALCLILIPAA